MQFNVFITFKNGQTENILVSETTERKAVDLAMDQSTFGRKLVKTFVARRQTC